MQPDVDPVASWSTWMWTRELRELKAVCINTVVLTWVATNAAGSDAEDRLFGPDASTDVVANLMSAAATVSGIDVVLGLQSETGWPTVLDDDWAVGAANRSAALAGDVVADLPADAPLKGWFLTPEPSPSAVRTAADRAAFTDYVGRTADALTALTPDASIVLAPAFDTWTPSTSFTALISALASVPGVTTVTLQDRTGEPWEHLADIGDAVPWFAAAQRAVRSANRATGQHVALWSDVETYRISAAGTATPATIRQIADALAAEDPYVAGFAIFSFVHYLSQYGWFPAYADPYADYIHSGVLPDFAPSAPDVTVSQDGLTNELSWPAATDQPPDGYDGTISYYQVTRTDPSGSNAVLATIRADDPPADCLGSGPYCFDDPDVEPGATYSYQVSAVNGVGNAAVSSGAVVAPTVSGADDLALGADYTLDPAPSSSYPDRGGRLTDGLAGPVDDQDAAWMGWADTAPTITVDLGAEQSITSVSSVWLQEQAAWVVLPASVTVSVSDDGTSWTQLPAIMAPNVPSSDQTVPYTWLGDAVSARYVRLTTDNSGGWLFASEITVTGPAPRSDPPGYRARRPASADYPDTGGSELLDGVLGVPGTADDPAWVGWWDADGLSITLTTGAPVLLTGVDLNVLDLPDWGIVPPTDVTVLVSTDGVHYTTAPATVSTTDDGLAIDLDDPVDQVTNVRIKFDTDPDTWLFLGEISLR